MQRRNTLPAGVAASVLIGVCAVLLAGCTAGQAPASTGEESASHAPSSGPPVAAPSSTTPAKTPPPSAKPSPAKPVAMPKDCRSILAAAVLAQLEGFPLNDPAFGANGYAGGELTCMWGSPVTDGETVFWRDGIEIDTRYDNLAPKGYTSSIIDHMWG